MRRLSTLFITLAICLTVLCATGGEAAVRDPLDFSLHKLGKNNSGPTLLVIGGIQGDEPGGFNAAALLASHYTIHRGQVWVVPNLNFASIIHRSRGVHGDMNRKFARLRKNDPEYHTVARIKDVITHPAVDLILNLHDGSGFYRPEWEDTEHNPRRWGQSVIIDQENIPVSRFGDLGSMGRHAVTDTNKALIDTRHRYHLKNTHTRKGDKEMEKTLTYFAINHGKPAFGVEASKSFRTHMRAYYHINVLESFMRQMGIAYERDFELTPEGISEAIFRDIRLAFHNNRICLDLNNVRDTLRYVPLQQDAEHDFTPSKPLLTVVPDSEGYTVYYGNHHLTQLKPQYFDYDNSLSEVIISIDGNDTPVRFGDSVTVRDTFAVKPLEGYRVNVIGFTRTGLDSEDGVTIGKADIMGAYSVDTEGSVYRVEVYKGAKFAGMILVRFDDSMLAPVSATATAGNSDPVAEAMSAANKGK